MKCAHAILQLFEYSVLNRNKQGLVRVVLPTIPKSFLDGTKIWDILPHSSTGICKKWLNQEQQFQVLTEYGTCEDQAQTPSVSNNTADEQRQWTVPPEVKCLSEVIGCIYWLPRRAAKDACWCEQPAQWHMAKWGAWVGEHVCFGVQWPPGILHCETERSDAFATSLRC